MMRLRALASVISAVSTPLILTACHHDITAPSPMLVWSTVASPTTLPLVAVWGSSVSDVWAVGAFAGGPSEPTPERYSITTAQVGRAL